MGKQITIRLSREKEIEFSDYLKKNSIKIIFPFCKKKKLYFLKDIPPDGPYLGGLDLWNPKFKLKPEFIEIKKEYQKNNYRYIFHRLTKPIIEYDRGPIYRIYWDKDFGISGGEYNIKEFEKWYNEIIDWFKKNCKKVKGVYIG
ncbi:MAG: hypothetical protein ABIH65_00680 [Nanoarchaeota archaeon]